MLSYHRFIDWKVEGVGGEASRSKRFTPIQNEPAYYRGVGTPSPQGGNAPLTPFNSIQLHTKLVLSKDFDERGGSERRISVLPKVEDDGAGLGRVGVVEKVATFGATPEAIASV